MLQFSKNDQNIKTTTRLLLVTHPLTPLHTSSNLVMGLLGAWKWRENGARGVLEMVSSVGGFSEAWWLLERLRF